MMKLILTRATFLLVVLLGLYGALLSVRPVHAQSPQALSVPLSSATCATTGCASINVAGLLSVAVQLTGTFAATAQFEATVDGSTWVSLNMIPSASATPASSATATGAWIANVGGYTAVRVRLSAYTSGIALASLQAAH